MKKTNTFLVPVLLVATIIGFTQCHLWETTVLSDDVEKVEIESSFNQMFSLDELTKTNIHDELFMEIIDFLNRGTEISNITSLDIRLKVSSKTDFTFIKINNGNKNILDFDNEFYFSETAIITLDKRKYEITFLKYYLGYHYSQSNKVMKFDFIVRKL